MKREELPIKFFAPRSIDELRIEESGTSEKKKWVLSGEKLKKHAEYLSHSLNNIKTIMEKRKASSVPFSFIAKIKEDATAKSKRKDIANFFQVKEKSSVIGLTATNKLVVSFDSLNEFRKISEKLKDCENNDYAISCITNFEEFLPNVCKVKELCNYKIKLINYQNYEQNLAMMRLLEHTLNEKQIKYSKTDYSEKFHVYKLKNINNVLLDELKETDVFNALFSIEPMPKYDVSLDSF